MKRILYIVLAASHLTAAAQVYHSCPLTSRADDTYENPLSERWLSAYDVKHIDLSLRVSDTSTVISGEASLLVEAARDLDTLVLELQDSLEVSAIYLETGLDGEEFPREAAFSHVAGTVYVELDREHQPGELIRVTVRYGGEAGQNRGFFAGITAARDHRYGFDVTYTLSEPLNASDWFPVKQVLEDKIDSVRLRIRCDTSLMAASNGLLVTVEPMEDGTHEFTWESGYPMAYYLLSFTVADYRDYSFLAPVPGGGDPVPVQNYIYDTDQVLADWEEEILETGAMLTLFSDLLTPYPFSGEKYGHAMAPMGGGMEHQTMTTLQDFNFYLVAHELAHQWFGNHVTCGTWQDIWINEGFASYMEYVAAQQLRDQTQADGWMSNAMSLALGETTGAVYVPKERVEDTYRLFDYGLSYKKGAILLHMIRYILDDDDTFFRVMRTYLEAFGTGLATGEDFRSVLEEESGVDFSCFFEQWYYGEGFPRFDLQWYQRGDTLVVVSEQEGSRAAVTPFFRIPFDLEILFTEGPSETQRFLQAEPRMEFRIPVRGRMVSDLVFDPENWILNTSEAVRQVGAGRPYVFGPNPVTGELYIEFLRTDVIDRIVITSMSGRDVVSLSEVRNPATLKLGGLADGAYVLIISENEVSYKERILKAPDRP